jgi:cytochrome c peroxidase
MNKRGCVQSVLVAFCLAFVSCDPPEEGVSVTAPESISVVGEYLNLPTLKADKSSPERITQLGRVLFYDKSLSANNSISCGSCHKQQYAFGDNVAFSKGFNGGFARRNTMPLMDVPIGGQIKSSVQGPVFFGGLFWDGRSGALPDAVSLPILNHIEMGMDNMSSVVYKLEQIPYYRELFAATYGNQRVNSSDLQQALSFFVLSLDSRDSRFQRYKLGREQLTSTELEGMHLFTYFDIQLRIVPPRPAWNRCSASVAI